MSGSDIASHQLASSIERLLATVDELSDADLAAPSLLPSWTRAHVLTHVARAADSRTRLLRAAHEGRVGRQYASAASRAREIEIGALRDPSEIRDDVRTACRRFLSSAERLPADRWDAPAEWLGSGVAPVSRAVPSLHREVEFHHVDLGSRYRPTDWPDDFVSAQLPEVVARLSEREDGPAVTLALPDGTRSLVKDGGAVVVHGPAHEILAWLTGRGDGSTLSVEPPGRLPSVPPFG